ncbi:MAG: methyltransferase domain-containing protein [Bacteroidetes bacterium]|nr:methyltransferase domain-containing protein [Bacteroidota bacterium]
MVGSMTPSSRFLAAKMLNHIPINRAKVVVELGPGTGVFTEKILEKLGVNTQLIVVELNDDFYNTFQNKFQHPNIHLKHGSADQIGIYLKELGFEKADLIISSLPLANFPSDLRKNVIETAKNCLDDKGTFIQFQYSLQSFKTLKRIFRSVKVEFTAFNFPPAFVYTCSK